MGTSATTARQDDGSTGEDPLLGPHALRAWVTGGHAARGRVFLREAEAGAEALAAAADPEDVILEPAGSAPRPAAARVVGYGGRLTDLGDELFLGERGVELQDYIAASFVQIVGPTAMRFFDEASWRAFLDDADLARGTGVFAAAMLDPRVLLADRSALARPQEVETPRAVRIDGDGGVHLGLQGEAIGHVDDLPDALGWALPRASMLGGVPGSADLVAELDTRPWLRRYLDAADLRKMLRLPNGTARIAGYGWALLDDDLADAEALADDPFLLDTAEGFLLADVRTLRRHLLSPLTAAVVDAIQTSSTRGRAAARVARACGVPDAHARHLCLEALAALGVHLGARTEDASGDGAR
ncbi:daptide biosynthesis RiPP recognition protein [Microbacterium paraoxydans]|uniref:daptide biosynthesis RiPP recognition protein n=1 Tax=Microbacterium paraoxydans TaxID=199592 RepID=UPI003D758428